MRSPSIIVVDMEISNKTPVSSERKEQLTEDEDSWSVRKW